MDYMTIKQAADNWGLSVRRVQELCISDRIPGAVKFGRDWAIPIDTKKPHDERIRTGKYIKRDYVIIKTTDPEIQYLCEVDESLAGVISSIGDLRYKLHKDYFAFLVTTIVGQQLSIVAAKSINDRLSDLCNGNINQKAISALSDNDLRSAGIGSKKIRYIRALNDAIVNKKIDFEQMSGMSDDAVIAELTCVNGIGIWTAKMFLIFALDRRNVLPYEDIAFLQAYKWLYVTVNTEPDVVKEKCKKWIPYSSVASRYLYKALDSGMTKNNSIKGDNNEKD